MRAVSAATSSRESARFPFVDGVQGLAFRARRHRGEPKFFWVGPCRSNGPATHGRGRVDRCDDAVPSQAHPASKPSPARGHAGSCRSMMGSWFQRLSRHCYSGLSNLNSKPERSMSDERIGSLWQRLFDEPNRSHYRFLGQTTSTPRDPLSSPTARRPQQLQKTASIPRTETGIAAVPMPRWSPRLSDRRACCQFCREHPDFSKRSASRMASRIW